MASVAQTHRNYTAEHYTPAVYIDAGRHVLGDIDLDPASCAVANQTVRARRYYTAADNGLERPWGGRVFMNPPNNRQGTLGPAFWRRACEHALFAGPGAAVLVVGFTLEQLRSWQGREPFANGQPCPGPLDWPTVVVGPGAPHASTGGRIYWVNGATGEPGKQPSHGNFFTLLGGDRAMRRRFRENFEPFGEYTCPPALPAPWRNLEQEILTAMRAGRPMSKNEIARQVGARKSAALEAVDSLVSRGKLRRDANGKYVSREAVPDGREPLKR